MPIWNRADICVKAIASVLRQTYQNYELIIVDDGSDDNLQEIISPYLSERVIFHRIPHSGVSAARNYGLKHTQGDYIAYLDSDNTWYPQFLSVMRKALNKEGETRKVAYCKYNLYKKIPIINKIFLRSRMGQEFNFKKLLKKNYIDLNTFIHAKECLETVGFFDESLKRLVDWDYIIRITAVYEPIFVPEILVNYYLNICDVTIAQTEREDIAKKTIRKKNKSYEWHKRNAGMIGPVTESTFFSSSSDDPRNPFVTVIVVNFNGQRFLENCIESVYSQTYKNLKIIIVDNASSDNSVESIKSRFKDLIIIENSSNLGFAGGVNKGIQNAWGSYLMTLNNDAWVDCHCVEQLLAGMMIDDQIGMCAAKMLFPDNRINSTGMCISRSGAAWDRGMFEVDTGKYDKREEIFGPCAGAALYRGSMLNEVGLFDEDFFLYLEDVDLAFRAHLAGWKCMYIPEAVVHHYHAGTAGYKSDLSIYYGNRNILWWPLKNYPFFTLLLSLPWIMGRTLGLIPYYALKGKGKLILKAKVDGLAGIPEIWEKRKNIRQMVSEKEINRCIKMWSEVK